MPNFFKLSFLIIALTINSCAITGSTSKAEKRRAVLVIKNDALTQLYRIKPDVKQQITSASGYAVFSNVNLMLLLASIGGGHGVVTNNQTGQQTYMKMGELGVGMGAGAKDFRAIFIFHNSTSLQRFIDHGWIAGISSDAAAKASDKGAAIAGSLAADNVTIYQVTESGLSMQISLTGTKYWKNDELN
ncbi:MAG: hypothetical protein PSN04_06835 [Methyloprofundus sp.]|nr:hypothetical protein [Methyloprofundus sp.]